MKIQAYIENKKIYVFNGTRCDHRCGNEHECAFPDCVNIIDEFFESDLETVKEIYPCLEIIQI